MFTELTRALEGDHIASCRKVPVASESSVGAGTVSEWLSLGGAEARGKTLVQQEKAFFCYLQHSLGYCFPLGVYVYSAMCCSLWLLNTSRTTTNCQRPIEIKNKAGGLVPNRITTVIHDTSL